MSKFRLALLISSISLLSVLAAVAGVAAQRYGLPFRSQTAAVVGDNFGAVVVDCVGTVNCPTLGYVDGTTYYGRQVKDLGRSTWSTPAYYTDLALGDHTTSVSVQKHFSTTVGTCEYPMSESDTDTSTCTVDDSSFKKASCAYQSCGALVTVKPRTVTKVVFKFEDLRGSIRVESQTTVPEVVGVAVMVRNTGSTVPLATFDELVSNSTPKLFTNYYSGIIIANSPDKFSAHTIIANLPDNPGQWTGTACGGNLACQPLTETYDVLVSPGANSGGPYTMTVGTCQYPQGTMPCSVAPNTPVVGGVVRVKVMAGMTTNVIFKTVKVNALSDIVIESGNEPDVYGKVDSLASQRNTSFFNDLSVGGHTAYATDKSPDRIVLRAGHCTTPRGTTCVPELTDYNRSCSGGWCPYPVTTVASNVTIVAFEYGGNEVYQTAIVVGVDSRGSLYKWPAPSYKQPTTTPQTQINGGIAPPEDHGPKTLPAGAAIAPPYNEASFAITDPDFYSVSATDAYGQTETAGWCKDAFKPPSNPCVPTDFYPTLCTSGWCTAQAMWNGLASVTVLPPDLPGGVGSRVWFRYTANNGDIEILRVGANGLKGSVPSGTKGKIDDSPEKTANPAFFAKVEAGDDHQAWANIRDGYTVSAGWCTYLRGGTPCPVTEFAPVTTQDGWYFKDDFPVQNGTTTRVVFKYTPPPKILIKRIGPDSKTSSVPANTTLANLDEASTSTAKSQNPAVFDLPTGEHIAYVTDVPEYEERYTMCIYPTGGTECNIDADTLDEDYWQKMDEVKNGFAGAKILNPGANKNIKVVVKYFPKKLIIFVGGAKSELNRAAFTTFQDYADALAPKLSPGDEMIKYDYPSLTQWDYVSAAKFNENLKTAWDADAYKEIYMFANSEGGFVLREAVLRSQGVDERMEVKGVDDELVEIYKKSTHFHVGVETGGMFTGYPFPPDGTPCLGTDFDLCRFTQFNPEGRHVEWLFSESNAKAYQNGVKTYYTFTVTGDPSYGGSTFIPAQLGTGDLYFTPVWSWMGLKNGVQNPTGKKCKAKNFSCPWYALDCDGWYEDAYDRYERSTALGTNNREYYYATRICGRDIFDIKLDKVDALAALAKENAAHMILMYYEPLINDVVKIIYPSMNVAQIATSNQQQGFLSMIYNMFAQMAAAINGWFSWG